MKTAVIVGSGFAGIAAAKVLAKRFDLVRVIEGDIPAQSFHLHVLLQAGQEALERIFPGIKERLSKAGCPEIDWSLDTQWENHDGEFPRYASSVRALSMSRLLLARTMRCMITENNVEFIKGKVSYLSQLQGDLIVIAGGQNLPLDRFLQLDVPSEKQEINLTYRSYVFFRNDLNLNETGQYYYQIDPSVNRMGGVISPIEDGKIIVTLIEYEHEYSECRELSDFLRKAREIPSDNFIKIIGSAVPCAGPYFFRKKDIHRRLLPCLPSNVVVLGDAVMSLNPVFGQGMTVALQQVELLQKNISTDEFQDECRLLGNLPYQLSRYGSQDKGLGKELLKGYLKLCQSYKFFHHLFLKQLHTLKVFP
ncbi:FAD-dependent oxidoreductase [Peredibacter starrii]|uniref:Squalene epoxidase domain-containing protein n=1 Tax=Peredibacter starrii TaxID=28202 RepID=A0AAX4HK03_9BACT|nr:hypothetical protein [Peredibacter starrii]WPU63558.1 hypothetical protein SOO65_12750 [Peredibacter starrii]